MKENIKTEELEKVKIYLSTEYEHDKVEFKTSRKYIFFWNSHKIDYFPLGKQLLEENKLTVALKVSESEKNCSIREIDCAPNKDVLAIVVDNLQTATIIQWDLVKNNELRAFEVDKNHQIIWGHDGRLVIVTEELTILSREQCSLMCFKNENFGDMHTTVHQKRLDYDQGYRFDSDNHNWLVLKEYISLSFSYMTFVIKENLENMDNDDLESSPLFGRAFDVEAYNYILNRTTCFMQGDLVKKKYLELENVLQNFERINPNYLELLNYKKCSEKKVAQK